MFQKVCRDVLYEKMKKLSKQIRIWFKYSYGDYKVDHPDDPSRVLLEARDMRLR